MEGKLKIILFIIIFFIFYLVHFYNIEKRVGFGWDQESYSYQVKNILKDHKLTLIGPRNADIKGFFLGPYFIYILIPFYFFTNLHPSALILFLIFFNLFFFFISFYLIKKMFDFWTAFYFFILWILNKQIIAYDITPWNPIFIPLGAVINLYFLKKITGKDSTILWIILGILSGLFINMHFSFIFIIIFNIFFLFLSNLKQKNFKIKNYFLFFLSFSITFLPLIIFDLRHDFLNIKLFINFFFGKEKTQSYDLFLWMPVFYNMIKNLTIVNLNNNLKILFFYLSFILIFFYLIKKEKENFTKIFLKSFLLIWLIFPIFFIVYNKRPSEYYFLFLMPYFYITIILFFNKIEIKKIFFLYLLIIFFINKNQLFSVINDDLSGLYYKDKTIKYIKKTIKDNKKFNISYKVPIGENNGYQYLIEYYDIKQSGNFNDSLIEIVSPPETNNIKFGAIGIKIPTELKN